ncbi:MAG TPA: aspartate/glutamate racemase family protein [Zeimonas sp.]|nr:aspartate/glutamate racemase family protein [Zeimonas sp.]
MKTIGLIGGMSWESTVPYYRLVNEAVKQRLGGLHSARLILYSVDFHDVEELQRTDRWDEAGRMLADVARTLERAGAELLALCANTMHKVAPAIEAAVDVPLLHVVEPTAEAVRRAGFSRVGLLGTRFTMEQGFYRDRLRDRHGLDVLIPDEGDRAALHRIIYEELCVGVVRDASRQTYRAAIERLALRGAQAVILGCTEISMLVGPADSSLPLFDTTTIHAHSIAQAALGDAEGAG